MPKTRAMSNGKISTAKTHVPEFPNEVWLIIFENLGFRQLKTCTRVCKTFNNLTKLSNFDAKLFRQKVLPDDAVIDVDSLQLHPALSRNVMRDYKIDDLAFGNVRSRFRSYEPWCLEDISAANEYATSPAVQQIRMQIEDFPIFATTNKRGVTVLQVCRAVCRFFGKKTHGSEKYQGLRCPEIHEYPIEEETFAHLIGGDNEWYGWDEKTLDAQGRLFLWANWFD